MRYTKHGVLLLVAGLVFIMQKASAQNEKLISVNLESATFEQFAVAVESQSSYHFYFNVSQLDSLLVSITVKDKPLRSILDAIFKETEFQYAIDPENKVYVTRKC